MINRIAIFPGSFDPYTQGHHDLVLRGQSLFDKIIVAIGVNSSKKRAFSPPEVMKEKIENLYKDFDNIEVEIYSGLTAEYAKSKNAQFILRGIRNAIDLEYESPISQANKIVNDKIESVFLISDPKLSYISSSIVRDLYRYNQDISKLLPYEL